ncbi:hypothetical protein G7054_g8114 [Neopestalotiopsis clavispora]|nr:hypothetical protein G7054_g8114 [Neopestalotiopsis clavispora]
MSSTNRIVELSSIIARDTAVINDFLIAAKAPTPSLDEGALQSIPIPDDAKDIKAARTAVLEACAELKALLTGPKELLRFQWTDFVSVKAILRFNLDKSFPLKESTTFEAMAEFSGLTVRNVRRLVRHGIINHYFFQENTPGVITHSALTAILASDDVMRNSLRVELDEFWPAGVKMADAMEKWPNSEESNQTGFSLANNSNKGMFDIFADNPERAARFGLYFSKPDSSADGLLENYPWDSLKTMVDVGGSHGSVAIAVAENFPHMKCFVQDLPDTVAEGATRLPATLKDRVEFMAYDFFTPQTVSADVYYFKSIFHNWADKYCIKILQNMIPALKKGAKIVIHERILPGLESLETVDARRAINLDIGMQQLLNAHQREMHEWRDLFAAADARYHYLGARQPQGAIRSEDFFPMSIASFLTRSLEQYISMAGDYSYRPVVKSELDSDESHIVEDGQDSERTSCLKSRPALSCRNIFYIVTGFLSLLFVFISGSLLHPISSAQLRLHIPVADQHDLSTFVPKLHTYTTSFEFNRSFAGDPSKDVTAAWTSLIPKGQGAIKLPVPHEYGGHIYNIAGFHGLHCLYTLRQSFFAFYDATTGSRGLEDEEAARMLKHGRHCIEYVRQALMCNPDLSLEPVEEGTGYLKSWGFERQCKDLQELSDWAVTMRSSDNEGIV